MLLHHKRRSSLRAILIAALLLPLSLSAATVTLDTAQGKLIGASSNYDANINVFKSIPYAKPPVGERRWTHASPAEAWSGTRLATQFSPSCMQQPYPEGSFFSRPSRPTSEDCLYLNVWSGAKAGEKLPVMVWIHGGNLTRGSGATEAYDGTALAKKGVILVTINYRLDVFGYFSHPELIDSANNKALSNFGTSDQISALQWVQRYIDDFGGDPDNVTIFGESAGSFSVHHLMASQQAKGLFHRAIGQSGSSLNAVVDIRQADNSAFKLAEKFQRAAKADSLQALKLVDANEILNQARGFRFRPVVDGNILHDQIYDLFKRGEYNAVPLMVGFNADEGTTLGALSQILKDAASFTAYAHSQYGELADDFLALYPANNLRRSTLNAFRDGFVTWGMQSWAMMMANTNQPAYLYYFSFQPAGEALGAYHAAEIVYAFDNVQQVNDDSTENHSKLASAMSDYWVAFAKQGNPNSAGSINWPAYTEQQRHYLEFNNRIHADKDLLPGVWEFHQRVHDQVQAK